VLTLLAVLGVLAVLFATAVLVTRADPLLADAPPDRADQALPDRPLTAEDVASVRFSLGIRGYRMSEVDAVLARLAAELADRDCRLEALEPTEPTEPAGASEPADAGTAPEHRHPDLPPAAP